MWSPTQDYLLPHFAQFQYRSASVETAILEQGRDRSGQQDGVEGKVGKSQHGRKPASARQSAGQGRPSRESGIAPWVQEGVPPLGCRVTAAQALPEPRALRSRRRRPPATSSGCCGGSPPPTRASPTRARTPEAAPSRGSSGSSAAGRTRSSTESGAEEAPALPSRAAVLTTMTLPLSKQESHYRRLYRTAHPALWDHVVRITWWRPHVTWSAASKRNLGLLLLSSWDVCLFRDKMLRRPTSVVQKRWVVISGPRAILWPTRWEEGQEGGQRTTSLLLSDFAENANGVWQTQSLSDLNMWYSCWPTWFQFTVWIRLKFLLQVRFKATFYRQKNREGRNPQLLWLPTSQTPLCELFLPRQ